MTQYYVIDSRTVEKIWCVIKSNLMYFVATLCYLSTHKESCGVLRVGPVMVVVVMINMIDIHRISWGLHPTEETLLNVAPK